MKHVAAIATVLAVLSYLAPLGHAQGTAMSSVCLAQRWGKPFTKTLFVTPADLDEQLERLKKAVGFSGQISTLECDFLDMVVAEHNDGTKPSFPAGNYIVYNDAWLKQVIFDDKAQLDAVLAHELGHFVNGDFSHLRKTETIKAEREAQADLSAGCWTARLGHSFSALRDVLLRLRPDVATDDYPAASDTIAASEKRFYECGGSAIQPNDQTRRAQVALSNITDRQWSISPPYEISRLVLTSASIPDLRAASDLDSRAALVMGWLSVSGQLGKANWPAAVRYWELAVASKNARAISTMGAVYEQGQGVKQPNLQTALRYYELAADAGNAYGQYNAGSVLSRPIGPSAEDRKRGLELLKAAAAQGHQLARERLTQLGVPLP